jgi:hypothetical protein
VNRLPEPHQRDSQQRRRDDQKTRSFHRVDMVSGMPRVGVRLVLQGGDHEPIVALDASEARTLVSAGGTWTQVRVLGLGVGSQAPVLRTPQHGSLDVRSPGA